MSATTNGNTNTAPPSGAPRKAHQRANFQGRGNSGQQIINQGENIMSMNLEIIKSIAAGDERYLSTSQACMVGLAL